MKNPKTLVSFAVAAALAGLASNAVAGGFGIATQSGSGTGNAFAGGAAAADDASVAWFNPAAMTLIPGKQVAGALHAVKPSFKYQDQGSSGVFAAQPSGTGGDAGDWAYIPNAFFTMAIDPKLSIGLALNVPFGLKTEYDTPWRGQLTAIKSEIKTVNINPSVAYKISDTVSLGAGVSVQKMEATLKNAANAAGTNIAEIKNADDIGYGFNLGLMVQAAPDTRIGVTYRSAIQYHLEGNATFSAVASANPGITADLKVPDSASLSVFHKMNSNWELMGDLTWTGWSSVQRLNVICTSTTAVGICPTVGSTLSSLVLNWEDTWRYAIGANYKMNDQTKLRVGAALDKTPTNDVDRTARLPDQDRTWLAFGVQYKPSKTGILDVGYAHEFIKDANVNTPVPGQTTCAAGCLTGTFKNKADIFSVQYSQSF
jgi:long-chain fatty acid transport protein